MSSQIVLYSVVVRTLGGVTLMRELFESVGEMERYYAELMDTTGQSLLDGLSGVDAAVVDRC